MSCRTVISVTCLIGATGFATAQTPAYSFEGGRALVATTGAIDRVLGWDFTVQEDVFVEALGYFDGGNNSPANPADGLFLAHDVAIYDSARTVVAQATVGPGTSGFLVNNWRYEGISDVRLNAGETYTIASYAPTGTTGTANPYDPLPSLTSDWIFSVNPPDVRRPDLFFGAEIEFEQSRFSLNDPGLTFPVSTDSGAFGLAGANFTYRVVPAPGVLGLVAGAGVFAARRRR